jgi:hypothetical protein
LLRSLIAKGDISSMSLDARDPKGRPLEDRMAKVMRSFPFFDSSASRLGWPWAGEHKVEEQSNKGPRGSRRLQTLEILNYSAVSAMNEALWPPTQISAAPGRA